MSVNKVILLGNVGQDPRVKYFDTGSAVATFPLATTDRAYTLSNGTQIPERTEWHNIVVSNRLAEVVDKYVHKGDKLYLEGKIRTRSYTDQSGATRYITEVYADNMEMLTPKGASTGASATASASSQMGRETPCRRDRRSLRRGTRRRGSLCRGNHRRDTHRKLSLRRCSRDRRNLRKGTRRRDSRDLCSRRRGSPQKIIRQMTCRFKFN
ncbi:single-stranded DNA-binding protein [Bacteroides pyogenes JCM 10003]|nr:single-stranded DNA-binding protein [Bacteroides pyogenes JCM 10003]